MEYIDGGNLQDEIDRRMKHQDGPKYFTQDEIYDYFVQICLGLKHIHDRKVIHRDLKAENIFLSKNGIVKIGDFGVSRICDIDTTKCRTEAGSPIIMSPELLQK